MSDSLWTRLRAPFPSDAVTWTVAEVDAEVGEAILRPRLLPAAIRSRLDDVAGPEGWSLTYSLGEGAVACTLEMGGVARSAVADIATGPRGGAEDAADRALARAAEAFGMEVPDKGRERTVPYDDTTGALLLDDEASGGESDGVGGFGGEPGAVPTYVPVPPTEVPDLAREAAEARGVPVEGQRMIDRLVERLKDEGQGLAAARLLVRYGGYGKDPAAARELYRELRALLVRTGEPSQAQG